MCKRLRANEWVFSSIFESSSTVYIRKFQRYFFRIISSRKKSANIYERTQMNESARNLLFLFLGKWLLVMRRD